MMTRKRVRSGKTRKGTTEMVGIKIQRWQGKNKYKNQDKNNIELQLSQVWALFL